MSRKMDGKPWQHDRQREWYLKNRELTLERTRKWAQENKERHTASKKAWAKNNKEKVAANARQATLKKKYGITPEIYEEMLEAQDGVCAICGNPPKQRRLHIDHCHKTNEVRALLCVTCNIKLGHLEGFKRLRLGIRAFERYLERFEDSQQDSL